jgi:hypothetical protein
LLGGKRELGLVTVDSGDQVVEVLAGEGPLERPGDVTVVLAEPEQSVGERVQRGEVVGDQCFALHDREVQLDLV